MLINKIKKFNNPDMISGRQEAGAFLTAGRKNDSGYVRPETTHQFWIAGVSKRETKGGNVYSWKPLKPGFEAYNGHSHSNGSNEQDPRTVFYCKLAYDKYEETCSFLRWCQKSDVKADNPEMRLPFCLGDGVSAQRWSSKDRKLIDIQCAGSECIFTIKKLCKKRVTVQFIPDWDLTPWSSSNLPKLPMVWTSQGEMAMATMKGVFDRALSSAQSVGLTEVYSWAGLPFSLSLSRGVGLPITENGKTFRPNFPEIKAAIGALDSWLEKNIQMAHHSHRIEGARPIGLLSESFRDMSEHGVIDEAVTPIRAIKPAMVTASIEDEIVQESQQPEEASAQQEQIGTKSITPQQWADLKSKAENSGLDWQRVRESLVKAKERIDRSKSPVLVIERLIERLVERSKK